MLGTAATMCYKRDNFFSVQTVGFEKTAYLRRNGAPPVWRTKENNVILGYVGNCSCQFRTIASVDFFFGLRGHWAVFFGIASFGFNFEQVSADEFMNCFGDFFGVAAV